MGLVCLLFPFSMLEFQEGEIRTHPIRKGVGHGIVDEKPMMIQ